MADEARFTQAPIEVLSQENPTLRATQVAVEGLSPNTSAFGRRALMVSITGSMTTDGDIIEMLAPDDAVLVLHRIELTQSSDAGEGQNEQLTVSLYRITGSPTVGSGGTILIPASLQGDDPVLGGTYVGFNTTALSGGTQAAIHTESWNIELGMNRIWTYKTRPVISPGTYALLTLDAAPFNSITFQVTVYFEGIGG